MAKELEQQLQAILYDSIWFMQALERVRELQLPQWCIGAGAIRSIVWDTLHRYPHSTKLADVDVAYFDAADIRPERDQALQKRLTARLPGIPWEVTNQAGVHLWFESVFGHPVRPLASLEQAISTWPETATAVGVALKDDGSLRVIAPYGLDDLFNMVVRYNPARASVATYRQRIAEKNYHEHWPQVTVLPG